MTSSASTDTLTSCLRTFACSDSTLVLGQIYRKCRRNLAAAFRTHILNTKEADSIAHVAPVRLLGSCSFMYMRSNDVYILAVTKSNANAMLAFQFMENVRRPNPYPHSCWLKFARGLRSYTVVLDTKC